MPDPHLPPAPSPPAGPAPAGAPAPARPAALRLLAGAATDVGAVRTENQDAYGVLPAFAVGPAPSGGAAVGQPALFVVADGMGGHEAGGEASRVAVEDLLAQFGAGFRSDGDLAGPLGAAVRAANAAVWARATAGGPPRRMGTTCTALLVAGGQAALGHVGDSRAYRVRDGHLAQLSTDHTLAEEAKTRPQMAAYARARRHHLTRALGVAPEVAVDAVPLGPLAPGDRFVLCSDGLEPVPPDDLARAAARYAPQEAADWLVMMASARGSRDNATALVVHVLP